MRTVRLSEKAVKDLRKGIPRIESGRAGYGKPGTWIRLADPTGRPLAWGLTDKDRNPFCHVVPMQGGRGSPPGASFFRGRMEKARRLREKLFKGSSTDIYRLINAEGDGIPGLVMDRYGEYGVAWQVTPGVKTIASMVYDAAMEVFGLKGIHVKGPPREGFHPGRAPKDDPIIGEGAPDAVHVREEGMLLEARLNEGPRTGIYPDQRENRKLLAPLVRGRKVLNTFSYTGAFSVSAALARAKEVVSVDLSQRSLDWSKRNFELNDIDPRRHRHVKADVFDYLKLARKRGFVFGVVILDPVTFSTSKKGTFRAKKDWGRLIAGSLEVLERDSLLALSCNTRSLSEEEMLGFLKRAARDAGRAVRVDRIRGLPPDFPCHPMQPHGRYLKFLLARTF